MIPHLAQPRSRIWAVRAHLRRLSESGGIRTGPFGPRSELEGGKTNDKKMEYSLRRVSKHPCWALYHLVGHWSKPWESMQSHRSELHPSNWAVQRLQTLFFRLQPQICRLQPKFVGYNPNMSVTTPKYRYTWDAIQTSGSA